MKACGQELHNHGSVFSYISTDSVKNLHSLTVILEFWHCSGTHSDLKGQRVPTKGNLTFTESNGLKSKIPLRW